MNGKPAVFLDILYEQGLLFFVIKNNSQVAATDVTFTFDQKLKGVDSRVEITELNIFKQLKYLAPHKEIKIFIDVAEAFFSRGEPTELKVNIDWSDEKGKEQFSTVIRHDFTIYKDLGYINQIN